MLARGVRLDRLDFQILREILIGDASKLQGRRAKIRAIAARTGVHANTVVRRLLALRLKRFILPPTLLVDMEKLGWHAGRALLSVPPSRRTSELWDAILATDGVFCAFEYEEGWEVAFIGPDGEWIREQGERVRNRAHAANLEWLIETSVDWPKRTAVELDEGDRQLILGLATDSHKSFGKIAKELSLEKRSLERRYSRLVERGVVRMFPSGGSRVLNMSVVNVQVALEEDADRDRVIEGFLCSFPDHFARDLEAGRPWLWAYAENPETLDSAAQRVRQMRGVRSLRILHSQGMRLSPKYKFWLAAVIGSDLGFADRMLTKGASAPVV